MAGLKPKTDPQNQKPLDYARCLMEHQFPVSKVSMESYKERKANYSQTLTGLGKWWGRKPLVLVRATLLGLLLPASDDPVKDREIFLKLMTMDEEGLLLRKDKSISQARLLEELRKMPPSVQTRFLDPETPPENPRLNRRLSREEKAELQRLVFERMPYSEKLQYCLRPEQIEGPSPETWKEINSHLRTDATNLTELVQELGQRRFGHRPRVGDSFCGAGSVPFEAARVGCDAYGSDLSPVAALLTWAALNIVGGGKKVAEQVRKAQKEIFEAVDRQITDWGIEHNEEGWRADAYLYCVEVKDPESGWMVPLAPSWVIGEKTRTVARLVPDPAHRRYDIEIREGVTDEEMESAREGGTVKDSRLIPPDGKPSTPMEVIRRNLRMWENDDLVPRPDDVFQERLYCIRWVEIYYEINDGQEVKELKKDQAQALPNFPLLLESGELKEKKRRHYRAPSKADLKREQKVLALLKKRFHDWQAKGYIPSRRIEPGAKTDEPIRTRGWTYWHHLFTPRQLLIAGDISRQSNLSVKRKKIKVLLLLGIGKCIDWNSKLCKWTPAPAYEKTEQTFLNQALNTLSNFGVRSLGAIKDNFQISLKSYPVVEGTIVKPKDVRYQDELCEIWITDPP